MRYSFEGKTYNIPDAEIEKQMRLFKLTREEACIMWLEDEGYKENEEVEALTAKAKENKSVKHEAKAEKKPRKVAERKPTSDPEKEHILDIVRVLLEGSGYKNVEITNKTKIIEFDIGENHYKFDLIKQRKPKTAQK